MINFILFGTFFIFLLLNTPIAVSLGMSSILAMIYAGDKMSVIPTNLFSGMAKFLLLAIPFFVLSGNVMAESGISKRLVHFIDNCIGHVRGGIAIVCVVVAMFFGAISGSGPATVAALGIILIPAMINQGGFSAPFASSLMAAASSIAIVIPPSIAFVVYASITGVSVGEMFMSGIVPGIMMGLALIVIVVIEVRKKGIVASRERASWGERLKSFGSAFWGLMVPVIILGGIYGGIFTPTEAAAVAVVYGLIIGVFVYKTVKLKDLYRIFIDSASTTATIMFITACASLFAYVLTRARIDVAISDGLINFTGGSTFVFFIIVNILLLIAGCFLDSTSALYIFTPLFVPVAQALGIDMIHLGVVMIVNLAIGLFTPPVGVNLYVACGVANVDLKKISKAVVPLLIASLIVLLLITYIPGISTMFTA